MRIDHDQLNSISNDITNKTKNAVDDSVTLSSFASLISNLIYLVSTLKLNELAMIVNSLDHWIGKKSYNKTTKYKPGTVIEFECGLNYSGELSYRHTGVVLEELDKMILVVPSTSRQEYINKSSEKPNGIWYYRLVTSSDGFSHDSVLLLNNLKMISKGRVITKFNKTIDGPKLDNIKSALMEHYFKRQFLVMKNEIADLTKQLEEQKNEYQILQNELEQSKNKVSEQKNRINYLYRKMNKKSH